MELINVINFGVQYTNGWLVDIVKGLIQLSSSIALGVILFTLILKVITLPFDFLSRASMRKNSLKMEEMRPELEKLKKQYANDKTLYNQKMMALYKKNGYSMWASCLPTILTLVIFILAINAFSNYSRYQNREDFYQMSLSYNQVIYDGIEKDTTEHIKIVDGNLVIDDAFFINGGTRQVDCQGVKEDGTTYDFGIGVTLLEKEVSGQTVTYYTLSTSYGYTQINRYYKAEGGNINVSATEYFILSNGLNDEFGVIARKSNNYLKDAEGDTFADASIKGYTAKTFIQEIGQVMSAKTFNTNVGSFLWVKNIWYTDSALAHPIEANWETFKKTQGYEGSMDAEGYAQLIGQLQNKTTETNGYFILVVLAAGLAFLMQFVSTKSTKAQMEFQTVDGQGMAQSKLMMWMMPLMMAVFSFFYTAAFSIYMVLSSVFTILSTLGINWIVDKRFKSGKYNKKQEGHVPDQSLERKDIVRGRVYIPKEEEKEKKKPAAPKVKERDFITGEKRTNEASRIDKTLK